MTIKELKVTSFITQLDFENGKTVKGGFTIDYTIRPDETGNNCILAPRETLPQGCNSK